jgi:hypothetical protein
VHDTLERYGWTVQIADAAKTKGLAPLAAKTTVRFLLRLEDDAERRQL